MNREDTSRLFKEKHTNSMHRNKTFVAEPKSSTNLADFLNLLRPEILKILGDCIESVNSFKTNMFVEVQYSNQGEIVNANLKTKNTEVLKSTNLEEFVDAQMKKIMNEMLEMQLKGSGHAFQQVLKVELRINSIYSV
jgi:septum formation topological specificity factor MinE